MCVRACARLFPYSKIDWYMYVCRCPFSADISLAATPPAAPVLIAVAFWDSPSVAVFSFSASSAANSTHAQAEPGDRQRGNKPPDGTAAVEKIATWRPPWGELLPLSGAFGSGASHDEAGAFTAATMERARGGGGVTFLTRALAFVRFGSRPEQISLVAATADGAVAVAEWQEGRGGEEDGDDEEKRCGGRTGETYRNSKSCLRGTLVTVASFQIGRGPVRLEVFPAAGRVGEVDNGGGGGGGEKIGGNRSHNHHDGERLFVNGDIMDAVVRRCVDTEGTTPNQCRGGWQCTQVGTSYTMHGC